MKRKVVLGLMMLALVLCQFRVARAGAQDFQLINQTGVEIHAVYVSPSSANQWEENILGEQVLADGQTLNVNFNAESDAALWDIRVEDENGGALMFTQINLLSAGQVTLGDDNKAYIK